MNEKPDMFKEIRQVVADLTDAGDEWAIEKMMEDVEKIFQEEVQKEINKEIVKTILGNE